MTLIISETTSLADSRARFSMSSILMVRILPFIRSCSSSSFVAMKFSFGRLWDILRYYLEETISPRIEGNHPHIDNSIDWYLSKGWLYVAHSTIWKSRARLLGRVPRYGERWKRRCSLRRVGTHVIA